MRFENSEYAMHFVDGVVLKLHSGYVLQSIGLRLNVAKALKAKAHIVPGPSPHRSTRLAALLAADTCASVHTI